MNLKELKKTVDRLMDHSKDGEESVAIALAEPSIGPIATTPLKSINIGFDWESGMCIVRADVDLVRKNGSLDE